ncbi:MAG TPA: hypothetical protein VJQ56_07150 [Blastocatellia bacterium]|nr:hypothetical protein [Blastocatellia bacterium]
MSDANQIDLIRGAALNRIDRSERHYRLAFFGAAVIETFFLVGFLLLADLKDRTQLLIFLATIAVYTILALGLVALGAFINRNTLRVLKAIEMLGRTPAGHNHQT